MKFGLDVSEHNDYSTKRDNFWNELMKSKFHDFIIIRLGFGIDGAADYSFLDTYYRAKEAGIKDIGCYWFAYAMNPEETKIEADKCINLLEKYGVELTLPIIYDMESNGKWNSRGFSYTRSNITNMAQNWIDIMKEAKLNTGIYASLSFIEDYIDYQKLGCSLWTAQYTNNINKLCFKTWCNQYTESQYIGKYGPFDANVIWEGNE